MNLFAAVIAMFSGKSAVFYFAEREEYHRSIPRSCSYIFFSSESIMRV